MTNDVRQVVKRIQSEQALAIGMALAARDGHGRALTEQEADGLTEGFEHALQAIRRLEHELTETRRARIGDSEIIGREMCRAEKAEAEVESLRLQLRVYQNGEDVNQPLADDIERWRQECEAKLTSPPAPSGWQRMLTVMKWADVQIVNCDGSVNSGRHLASDAWEDMRRELHALAEEDYDAAPSGWQQRIAAIVEDMRKDAREWRGVDPINNRTARQLERFANQLESLVQGQNAKDALPPSSSDWQQAQEHTP